MKQVFDDKLNDYADGFSALGGRASFPVGAIIADNKKRKGIIAFFKKKNITVIKADKTIHPDIILGKVFQSVLKKKTAVLDISEGVSPKIITHLENLSRNFIDVKLAQDKECSVFLDIPAGSKLLLLMNNDDYENILMPDVISSVCRV